MVGDCVETQWMQPIGGQQVRVSWYARVKRLMRIDAHVWVHLAWFLERAQPETDTGCQYLEMVDTRPELPSFITLSKVKALVHIVHACEPCPPHILQANAPCASHLRNGKVVVTHDVNLNLWMLDRFLR